MEGQFAPVTPDALPHVQAVLRTAEQELAELFRQRADLMKRIGTIKQMLLGLANHFGQSMINDELQVALDNGRASDRRKGLTRSCRQILMESRVPLPARLACEELRRRFPELAGRHKDLAASVTTVFHRLVAYGEARSYLDSKGTRVWEWIAEPVTSSENSRFVTLDVQPHPPQPDVTLPRLHPD
jgi:hypothetical protein